MSYLVLARKYRPKNLAELIGQDHVTQTLLNAFKQNKVGQAYIFTGTRGIGKTSVGRIIAKALRCEAEGHREGEPSYGIPCNNCHACSDVDSTSSLDVLEIDGASNNGVDSVRELRENVKFMPSSGKKKVIIIDEVHMLTQAAFNALLKTLEEPPEHAAFIFATTDIHKVPATILSRCQRFDLKRLPQSLIYDYLLTILEKEKVSVDTNAVQLIARKADGSVRDALSLTDQVIALSGNEITYETANAALGLVDRSLLIKIMRALVAQEPLTAIHEVHDAYNNGFEMKSLLQELAELYRDAIMLKLGENEKSLSFSASDLQELKEFLQGISYDALQVSFQLLVQAVTDVSRSPLPLASTEITLARLCSASQLQPVADLVAMLRGASPSTPNPTGPSGGGFRPSEMKSAVRPGQNTSRAQSAPTQSQPANQNNAVPIFGANSSIQPGPSDWKSFVSFAIQAKPSIGSLLEHAIPLDSVSEWKSGKLKSIRLGFRENHTFYLEQAKNNTTSLAIREIISSFVGKEMKVEVQKIFETEQPQNLVSISEKKEKNFKDRKEKLKSEFLAKELVKDTKEIFGAELSSFKVFDPKD